MNLYTRIWLKLAPKGWEGIKEEHRLYLDHYNLEAHRLKNENEKLRKDVDSLKGTVASLFKSLVNMREYYLISHSKQAAYNSLAHQKEGE